MTSTIPAAGCWNDHRLRQIKTAARFVAAVLEEPLRTLLSLPNAERLLEEVANLNTWLAPCELWSQDETTRPPGMRPALFEALYTLHGSHLRLDVPKAQDRTELNRLNLDVHIRCHGPLARQFHEAVERLCRCMDQEAACSQPTKQEEQAAQPPQMPIRLPEGTAAVWRGTFEARPVAEATCSPTKTDRKVEQQIKVESRALMILREHPDWSNKQIAEVVGCNANYLSQLPTFKTLRQQLRAEYRAERRQGFRTGPGEVDAAAQDDEDEE